MKSVAFLVCGRYGLAKRDSSPAGNQEVILPYGESVASVQGGVAGGEEFESGCGMMVLPDVSRHDWLEGRGPALTLIGFQLGTMRRATSEDFPGTEFSTVVVSRT
jgi:hypothetical protein